MDTLKQFLKNINPSKFYSPQLNRLTKDNEFDYNQLILFTEDLTILNQLIQNIETTLDHAFDYEIETSIFFNSDDENYLLTFNIYNPYE